MIDFFRNSKISHSILSITSGILLYLAFPPACMSQIAWFALVPLLYVAIRTDGKQSFRYGLLCGMVFWLLNLSWLLMLGKTGAPIALACLGWFFLSLYCAGYVAVFAGCSSFVLKHTGSSRYSDAGNDYVSIGATAGRLTSVLLISVIWVGLEYIRSTFLTGFSWNQLGVSQFTSLVIIQIAGISGVFGVSMIIVLANIAILFTGIRISRIMRRQKIGLISLEPTLALIVILGSFIFGLFVIKNSSAKNADAQRITIVAIQPCIEQCKKWPDRYELEICETLKRQTEYALLSRPELLVWPETSLPTIFPNNPYAAAYLSQFATNGSQLLFGALEEGVVNGKTNLYNSSFLVADGCRVMSGYRKRHLVPFGEYVPLSYTFTMLEKIAPLGFNCYPGLETVIMNAGSNSIPFSALICFEDAYGYLARQAVKKGARFLINQTNDAWFDGTCASLQHMSHCVFRCVENSVPAVRCANSGVTCFITETGIVDILRDEVGNEQAISNNGYSWIKSGAISFEGFKLSEIRVSAYGKKMNLYTKYGDWMLALPCTVLTTIILAYIALRKLSKRHCAKA